MSETVYSGGCLCGAVRYEVTGSLRPVVGCHCRQCRRTSGHYVAATQVANERLRLLENRGLTWYPSSADARRGFCASCGSSLFWQRVGDARTAIMAGTLDEPTGLELAGHIYVADKGDYYDIGDELPQLAQGSSRELLGTSDAD